MTNITQASTVIVPVTDHDRAIAFYVGVLGFEKRLDFTYADGDRWGEVAPQRGATTIALVAGDARAETGIAGDPADVEADHAALLDLGTDADERTLPEGDAVVRWPGAPLAGPPPMFLVRDPDGNSF